MYTVTGNVTLTAQWEANSYQVKYSTSLNSNQRPTVTINNISTSNGNSQSVQCGTSVTVKVTGVSSNTTRTIVITDASGNELMRKTVKNKNTAELTFTMPAGDVTITISQN